MSEKDKIPPQNAGDLQYEPARAPVIYADFVPSLNIVPGVVAKFWLVRFDPDIGGAKPSATIVAQVAMPTVSFLNTAAYFNARIKLLIKEGSLTQAEWDKVQAESDAAILNNIDVPS